MKKTLSATILSLVITTTFSQINWQKGGNTTAPIGALPTLGTNYLAPLQFLTNSAERMRLTPTGELGVGLTTPSSMFHLQSNATAGGNLFRTDGLAGNINKWQLYSGVLEKFSLYNPANSPNMHLQTADLNSNLIFETQGASPRVTIFSTTVAVPPVWYQALPGGGGMAINANPAAPIQFPLALLHIGEQNTGQNGWRDWMETGTYYSRGTDQMYVGMKSEGALRNSAVINWGDNTTNGAPNSGPDFMRFIFTAPAGNPAYDPFARALNGLEVMRMAFNGNVGVGNFFNNALFPVLTPARRFEILSDKIGATLDGNPIFRLTHSQQLPLGPLISGIYDEFQPMNNGNLFISARDNTQVNTATYFLKERFVGINTNTAGNTLEINSQINNSNTLNGATQAAGFGPATGLSGLRFTDLNSISVPQSNPGLGVLALDANGDVIYVPAGVGGGPDNDNQNLFFGFTGNVLDLGITGGNTIHIPLPSSTVAAKNGAWVNGANEVEFGTNPLVHNTVLPMNGYNLTFSSNNALGLNRFSIGSTSSQVAKFNVVAIADDSRIAAFESLSNAAGLVEGLNVNIQNTPSVLPSSEHRALQLYAKNAENNFGIVIEAANGSNLNSGIDILTRNQGGTSTLNRGVRVNVSGAVNNYGYDASVMGTTGSNYGGVFNAYNSSNTNIGIFARVNESGTNNNTALYALAPTNANSWAARFEGNVKVDGVFTLNGTSYSTSADFALSDQNLKTNIDTIANSLSILKKLEPKEFYYDTINNHGFNFSSKKQYGFLAQQIDTVLHELVTDNTKPAEYDSLGNIVTQAFDYKALNYNAFFGILTQVAKEQQAQIENQQSQIEAKDSVITDLTIQNQNQQTTIDDLNTRLSRLESCLSSLLPTLCEMNQSAIQQTPQETQRQLAERISISLSDKNTLVLSQNVPNPFAEKTVISYNIPTNVAQVQIHFYNGEGKIINSVDIKERGNGELTVFANDLSSGIYTYTLVADGKIVATKKMMKN